MKITITIDDEFLKANEITNIKNMEFILEYDYLGSYTQYKTDVIKVSF